MYLDDTTFKTIVANTPLVSIDLIIRDDGGRVLLGRRINKPAQGYWFVPGGRIYKGESIAAAIARISQAELGFAIDLEDTQYLGLYEHFYQTSSFDEGVSTHYVVNAFECQLKRFGGSLALPEDQHSDYQWLSVPELLDDESVHRYSRWYFQPGVGVKP